jgi:four helix bundle suffix protein
MELKLTNVARASLEELRLDYEDYLRHRSLPLWPEDDLRRKALVAQRCTTADEVAAWIREVHGRDRQNRRDGQPKRDPAPIESIDSIKSTYPELAANAALVLIGVACALLGRQIDAQAKAFTDEGGFTERLHRIRTESKRRIR